MIPEDALAEAQKSFPFKGYIDVTKDAILSIARIVQKWLKPPAKILDYGAGPCDKTAILSLLGYECAACDDLQDYWHLLPGNRDKILTFAKKLNINYFLIDNKKALPYKKEEFDMLLLFDVLEHLHNSPRDLVNDLLEFVKPRGFLFITVPNAANLYKRLLIALGRTNLPPFESYYWSPNPWRGHVREYVRDDLIKLAHYLNFEILQLHGCHHQLNAMPSYLRPIWKALTGIIPNARDSLLLIARKNPDWAPKKSLSSDELKTILNRYTSYQS